MVWGQTAVDYSSVSQNVTPSVRPFKTRAESEILLDLGPIALRRWAVASGISLQQVAAQISTELNNSFAFVFLPFNFKFTEDLFPEDDYIATIPVRIYSDPGTTPSVLVRRNSTQGESASGSVQCFGYLINLP